MRVPALRLPSFRLSFDWLEGLGGRRVLWYSLYTGILFAVFLVANFPFGIVLNRVLQMVEIPNMRVEVGDARFAWWHGFELQRVRVASTTPDQPPLLEAASLYVRPGLDGLLRGRLDSVHISGPMYGGQIDGSFGRGDDVTRATLTLDRVDLQRYPALRLVLPEGQIGGVVSGVISVEAHGGDSAETKAAGELDVRKASIVDLKVEQFPVPPLHFDTATLKFSLQANRLDIQELEADGPELKLLASGQVAVRAPVADSVLNLKVTVAAGPDSPDTVKGLLSLLPPLPKGQKPDSPRVISGTLAKPRIR
jgi:type II secretion system protein N